MQQVVLRQNLDVLGKHMLHASVEKPAVDGQHGKPRERTQYIMKV